MWSIKVFDELSLLELEQILRLRQDVFIIEQESLFTDIDGQDSNAIHMFSREDEEISSYCRMIITDSVTIGRVIVNPNKRNMGRGKELFTFAVDYIKKEMPSSVIKITAMSYLEEFYKSFGFEFVSPRYDIAGHQHVDMELKL